MPINKHNIQNKILPSETLDLLHAMASNFGEVWAGMVDDGFHTDEYIFSLLAKLEPQDPDLLTAKEYFTENIKEILSNTYRLKFGRNQSNNNYRSNYLDWLDEQIRQRKWAITDKGLYTQPSLMMIYNASMLAYQKPLSELKKEVNENIKQIKNEDIKALKNEHESFFNASIVRNKSHYKKILNYLFEDIGFTPVNIKKDLRFIVYSKPLPRNLSYFSISFDVLQWAKYHRWHPHFSITQEQVAESFVCSGYPRLPVLFDLDFLFPSAGKVRGFLNYDFHDLPNGGGSLKGGLVIDDWDRYSALYIKSAIKQIDRLASNVDHGRRTTIKC